MFLIVGADKEYLAKALSVELAYQAGTALTWQKLYKDSVARGGAGNMPDLLDKLRGDDGSDQKAVFEAKQRLLGMKSARSHDYRRHRARQKMKMLYLWLLAPVLLGLTLIFGVTAV